MFAVSDGETMEPKVVTKHESATRRSTAISERVMVGEMFLGGETA